MQDLTPSSSLFRLLAQDEILNSQQAASLAAMAGFRNILVHGYQEVDLATVRDILHHHLDDLLAYCAAVNAAIQA